LQEMIQKIVEKDRKAREIIQLAEKYRQNQQKRIEEDKEKIREQKTAELKDALEKYRNDEMLKEQIDSDASDKEYLELANKMDDRYRMMKQTWIDDLAACAMKVEKL